MTESLLALDTDRIKSYVFATGKLAEIRGASALLDRLNRQTMRHVVNVDPDKEIYAHGGSGLFVVPNERVAAIITDIQRCYQETTTTATLTGTSVPLPAGFTLTDDLPPYWRLLGTRLRAAKDQHARQASNIAHPFIKPCESCGVLPARRRLPEPGAGPALLCQSCATKREEDWAIKDTIANLIQQGIEPDDVRLWDRLVQDLRQQNYPFGTRNRPEDFTQLGDQSDPEGYLGLIYADGDGMGHRLETIPSLSEMRTFANAIDTALYGAVRHAILQHLRPQPNDVSLPFDVLLLGGDDLVMVTRAQAAIQTAMTIVEQFPSLVQQGYAASPATPPPSLSVAVIIAHVNFPFRTLIEIAEGTLKFAKKQRAKRGVSEGLLNFLVVNSANHLDFKAYYDADLKHDPRRTDPHSQEPELYRTLRPYTLTEMQTLLQARDDLREAPRTKLEQLRSAVFKPRTQAMLESAVALLRWRNADQQRRIQQLPRDFADSRQVEFPWFKRDEAYHTPLLDLVEVFDFLP